LRTQLTLTQEFSAPIGYAGYIAERRRLVTDRGEFTAERPDSPRYKSDLQFPLAGG
jgi:hypothetical protein